MSLKRFTNEYLKQVLLIESFFPHAEPTPRNVSVVTRVSS